MVDAAPKGGFSLVMQNPYLCGVASVSPSMCLDFGLSIDTRDSSRPSVVYCSDMIRA